MSEREEAGVRDRRLLVAEDEERWNREPSRPQRTGLQSLGDDGHFFEAILGGMLESTSTDPSEICPVGLLVEADEPADQQPIGLLMEQEDPFAFLFGSMEPILLLEQESLSPLEPPPASTSTPVRDDATPPGSDTSTLADPDEFPSTITELVDIDETIDAPTDLMPSTSASLDLPGPSSADFSPSAPPLPQNATSLPYRLGENKRRRRRRAGGSSPWRRPSMRRLRPWRPSVPPTPPRSPQPQSTQTPTNVPVQEEIMECEEMGGSPLGQWPHGLSSMMACLACTLGLFNISRFAVLSVQYGGNFVIQFLVMSLVLGIPLFTFQVSLGQLLGSGAMDMWRISPIFQGIGIALILAQALLGIYSIVGVSWMFIYFRDSFITKQDTYRWSVPVPYDGFQGLNWRSNISVKIEETVANYFSGVVLQRSNLDTPANAPGHLKFQVTFNLAVVWMIVFISLSKGLKSYGKVVFLFSLAPAFGMLVLCTKLLGLAPHGSKIQMGFPQSDWSEFFYNSKSWSAAMSESFYTWGLLGVAAMQMASHNRPKHLLHRDTSFVTTITIIVLVLAAFLANTCSQLLSTYGYTYVPSSFERASTYGFLHPKKTPLPASLASIPQRWLPRSLLLAGERIMKPAANARQQSGYQALRLATELVPATLAVLGPSKLSPFWSVLFYFVLILFGIAQQLAIMHCVITGIMAIKVKSLKSWETTITFFTCVCGFVLGLPMATELGIFVVYFLDYTVGGGWWIMLLYLAELIAVFMVRGRPYSGETVVATLFAHAGRCLQEWAAPVLSFTWNVILPVMLMVLCISVFKNGNYRELLRVGGSLNYEYWPSWSRELGALIQLVPLLAVPLVGLLQGCRYLSSGPPDIFDRIQLLYRPPEEALSGEDGTGTNNDTEAAPTNTTQTTPPEDPPPKYTPPPSYSTATGARIAKLMRQSFRRSVRRIQTALGGGSGVSGSGSGSRGGEGTSSEPPPPDYEAVLVEIHQSLGPTTSTLATVSEVAARLRSSFRRAISSQSTQSLVPASRSDSLILDDKRIH